MNEIILTIGAIILGLSPIFAILGVIYYYDKKAKKNTMDKWGNKPSDYAWNRDVANYLTSNAG